MQIHVVDNFLSDNDFKVVQENLLYRITWKYEEFVDYQNEEGDNFQFTHSFFKNNQIDSQHINLIKPILDKLRVKEYFRIKANLQTKTHKIQTNNFHTDITGNWGVIPYTTSIFYVNSNDGYTEFENGAKVDSVGNRFVSFPSELKHRGTTCTNSKVRSVLNLNYFT